MGTLLGWDHSHKVGIGRIRPELERILAKILQGRNVDFRSEVFD